MIDTLLQLAVDSFDIFLAFLAYILVHTLGVARERNRKPRAIPKDRLNLTCGCQHQLSFHDGLGACRHEDKTLVYKGGKALQQDGRYVYATTPCTCQQYTGDLPADWFSRDSMRELNSSLPGLQISGQVEPRVSVPPPVPPDMPTEGTSDGSGQTKGAA